ncbi:hypothetical protein [Methanogenium organophilum]|uniref:Uncharacterized protein n=1 Tax=Methanogenium organophilum TaxID=2199 RepID=A0A9X9S696_METOG|nr:hypothetical protein [Methanogenium organophilum]WAI02508.1 hypothetical protein OU421_06430 [Methanogenium organophilum]
MTESEQIHRDSTRAVFLEQARARLDEVRELDEQIRARIADAPDTVQADVVACNVDVGMYVSLAEVEIDLLENAEEDEWIRLRSRVDTAIGKAMGELERCDAILDRPPEHVQWK